MFPRCCASNQYIFQISKQYAKKSALFAGNCEYNARSIHHISNRDWNSTVKSPNNVSTIAGLNLVTTRNISQDSIKPFPIQPTADTFIKVQPAASHPSVTATNIPSASTPPSFSDIPPIPDAPPVPVLPDTFVSATENFQQLLAGAEPTFASIGLGGWTPVGIVQNCMEFLHIGCEIPWWGAIIIGTVAVRTLLFPLVILSQRNAAKMNNNLPQMQVIQMKMTEARQMGNALESAKYGQEMMLFMKEKELNPLKNLLVPLVQAPIFISFFMGLRQMANTPVESLATGGIFWFTDLTMPDPFFLLPLITSATLYLTIELGTDTARLSSQNMQTMKYVLRALPIVIFPFTMNFPGLILCYWASTNFISLIQVGILRIPRVREFFKIEKLVSHTPDSLPVKPKKFVEGIKESWTNIKITRELQDRERFDDIQFQRAGSQALVKTYKYDPTKPRTSTGATIQAKKR